MMAELVDHSISVPARVTTVELIKERRQMDASPVAAVDPGISTPRTETVQPPAEAADRRLNIERRPGELVLAGEIDIGNVETLKAALQATATAGNCLVVDMCAVTYLDSAGISVLFDQVRDGMTLRVSDGTAVATVIRICALPHVAQVEFVTPGTAVAAPRGR